MKASDCSFNADTHAPGVHRCPNPATCYLYDQRPLPDGTLRPPIPCCTAHGTHLLRNTPPRTYVMSFTIP